MSGLPADWMQQVHRLACGNGLRTQLLRDALGSLGIKAIQAALRFALAVIIARLLGSEGYGVYAFSLALLMLVAIPAQAGVPQLLVRETAKARNNEDWSLMRGLWRWGNSAVFALSAFSVLTVGGILALLSDSAAAGRVSTITIGIGLIPLIALANLRSACLRGLGQVVWGQLPENVFRPLLLLILVIAWLVAFEPPNGLTPSAVMGLHVTAATVTFFAGWVMLLRAFPEGIRRRPAPRYNQNAWRQSVIPLAMITGLQLINSHADLILLGLFTSNEEVGVYRAVSQTALLVVFGLQAMNPILQPYFARLYDRGETANLERLATNSARAILLLALPPVLVCAVLGEELLAWLFGDTFRSGGMALALLAMGQLVNAAMGSVIMLLNMTGHERDTVRGVVVGAALNIVLNCLLIPIFGIEGAAASTSITLIFWNLLLRHYVKKRLNIRSSVF